MLTFLKCIYFKNKFYFRNFNKKHVFKRKKFMKLKVDAQIDRGMKSIQASYTKKKHIKVLHIFFL